MPKVVPYRGNRHAPYTMQRVAGGPITRFAAAAANSVTRAALSRPKVASRRSTANKQAARGDGGVITNQFDTKLEYRRKSGKRKGGKSRRFAKKVMRVVNTTYEKNVYTVALASNKTWVTPNQGILGFGIYTYGNFSQNMGDRDMYNIFQNYVNTSTGVGTVGSSPKKIFFRNCHVDFFIKNHSGTESMYVDVYECVPKRDINYDSIVSSVGPFSTDFANFFTTTPGAAQVNDPGVPGKGLTPATGNEDQNLVTAGSPFCAPSFQRYFTVNSKRKFFLTPAQHAHFDYNISKDFWETQQTINSQGGLAMKKGRTKFILFMCYNFVGNPGSSSTMFGGGDVSIACTKTYHFTVPNAKTNPTSLDYVKYDGNYAYAP